MSEKNYFSIEEISKRTHVPAYTIRYWESRFKLLRPLRLASGHRRYTSKDIDLVNEIKDLVLAKGYTLAGARKFIYARQRQAGKSSATAKAAPARIPADEDTLKLLEEIRKELQAVIKECGPG